MEGFCYLLKVVKFLGNSQLILVAREKNTPKGGYGKSVKNDPYNNPEKSEDFGQKGLRYDVSKTDRTNRIYGPVEGNYVKLKNARFLTGIQKNRRVDILDNIYEIP